MQAKVDAYMAWQHLNMRAYGVMYFQTGYLIPRTNKQPINEKKLAKAQQGLESSLDAISNIWLKDGTFIAGKEISVADLLAVAEMEQPGNSFLSNLREFMYSQFCHDLAKHSR